MKPILYAADELNFTSNGLGRLSDCISCKVTEERNGIYICEFVVPVTSPMFSLIQEGRYIAATHDDRHDVQPFEIYGRTTPIDGLVTFYAHHLSYKLKNVILKPFTASSCAQALAKMQTETYNRQRFTFWTDKSVSANFVNDVPASCRSLLAGQEGSILDVYGTGEYEFDKWAVKLHLHRGTDNGVSIRYGVNLTALQQDTDTSESYSALAPYWKSEDGETVVMLPEGFITASNLPVQRFPWTTKSGEYVTTKSGEIIEFNVPQIIPVAIDLSEYFETAPTVQQLRDKAAQIMENNAPWLPTESISVSFVDLAHTEDYKDIAALQRVSLCDSVSVFGGPLGVKGVSMKVVKTVYNVLTDTYDEIELGAPRTNFADTVIADVDKKLENFPTFSEMQASIDHATELISGGLGGYVVFGYNANGEPEEILIMDTPDKQTAVNVWRFNKNGLGHSHNGYDGPFDDVALTADGKINANMITTGVLLASLIKAGVLSALNNSANYWNMETGEFVLKSDGATNGIIYKNGVLHINASNIDVGTLTANLIKAGILQDEAGLSFWNMITGEMSVNGKFTATTTGSGNKYTVEIDKGYMYFKKNGTTFGWLNPTDGALVISGGSGMEIGLYTNSNHSSGCGIILNPNGTVEINGTTLDIEADVQTFGYTGIDRWIDTVNGQIHVVNGLIVEYVPDT